MARFFSFPAGKKNDGAHDSGRGHEFRVVGRGSEFTKYLISVFEALKERNCFVLKPPLKFGDQGVARRNSPPKFSIFRTS